jgi:hypothetical protein
MPCLVRLWHVAKKFLDLLLLLQLMQLSDGQREVLNLLEVFEAHCELRAVILHQ